MKKPRTQMVAAVIGVLVFAAVGYLQVRAGGYDKDLASHPDEAAHFVTGVMVYDYVRTAFGSDPMAFAEEYYLRYPKVAIGHWPPLFYILQALWFGVAGVSTSSALVLVGMVTAIALAAVAIRLTALHGPAMGVMGAIVLLWSPVVHQSATAVLSDMFAALLTLLALLALSDARQLLDKGRWVRIGIWTGAAILAKTSAIVVAALVIWEARRMLLRARTWVVWCIVALALFGVGGVIFYRGSGMFSFDWISRLPLLTQALHLFPWPVMVIALCAWWPHKERGAERAAVRLTMTAFILVSVPAQLFARDVVEPRYFLPLLFPVLFLFAEGARTLMCPLPARFELCVPAALASLWILTLPAVGADYRSGYGAVAHAIPRRSPVLVSADASGEGAFIAARLVEDRAREGVVLRSTKLLMKSDWMGRDYQQLVHTSGQLEQVLNESAVRFLVLDKSGYLGEVTRPHHRLLLDSVRDTTRFRLAGSFPLVENGVLWGRGIQVYEYLAARDQGIVRVDLGNSVGRTLQLAVKSSGKGEPIGTSRADDLVRWTPAVAVEPKQDRFDWLGGTGAVYFTGAVPPVVTDLPSWISQHTSTPFLTYRVAANRIRDVRSATIRIGGQPLVVKQERFPYLPIPYEEAFTDWQDRWMLESQGARAKLTMDAGTESGSSLLLTKARADAQPYLTQVYLPFLEMEMGRTYELAVAVRSEQPATIGVTVAHKRPPYGLCGIAEPVPVTAERRRHTFRFVFSGDGCGADSARLSFLVGSVAGRLWISDLSVRAQ